MNARATPLPAVDHVDRTPTSTCDVCRGRIRAGITTCEPCLLLGPVGGMDTVELSSECVPIPGDPREAVAEPEIVRGGQGHSSEDICDTAVALVLIGFAVAAAVAVLVLEAVAR